MDGNIKMLIRVVKVSDCVKIIDLGPFSETRRKKSVSILSVRERLALSKSTILLTLQICTINFSALTRRRLAREG